MLFIVLLVYGVCLAEKQQIQLYSLCYDPTAVHKQSNSLCIIHHVLIYDASVDDSIQYLTFFLCQMNIVQFFLIKKITFLKWTRNWNKDILPCFNIFSNSCLFSNYVQIISGIPWSLGKQKAVKFDRASNRTRYSWDAKLELSWQNSTQRSNYSPMASRLFLVLFRNRYIWWNPLHQNPRLFFMYNIFVMFCWHVFQQTVDILMGTNCTSLLIALFIQTSPKDIWWKTKRS